MAPDAGTTELVLGDFLRTHHNFCGFLETTIEQCVSLDHSSLLQSQLSSESNLTFFSLQPPGKPENKAATKLVVLTEEQPEYNAAFDVSDLLPLSNDERALVPGSLFLQASVLGQ